MSCAQACDSCKRRKVRCDELVPCSNCRISQLPCEHRISPKRRGPRVMKRPLESDHDPDVPDSTTPFGDTQSDLGNGSHGYSPAPGVASLEKPQGISPDVQQSPASILSSAPAVTHVSPHPVTHVPPVRSMSIMGAYSDAAPIYFNLLSQANSMLISGTVEDVAGECINQFMQFIFPNMPIVHEPTLRDGVSLFSLENSVSSVFTEAPSHEMHQYIDDLRSFTLIAALCAFVVAVVPGSHLHRPKSLATPFLQASLAMLRVYEAYDLEHPNSTSLTIRMLHSAAMQNTTGQVGASWHYHTEAACLAQRLQLFSEDTVAGKPGVESQLLRVNFWLLYLAEKTAVAYETRPPIIDERLCDGGITLLENGDEEVHLLDGRRKVNGRSLEQSLLLGFHLKRRIWEMAAELLGAIKSYARRNAEALCSAESPNDGNPGLSPLVNRYLVFTAFVDELPPWLQNPDNGFDATTDDEVADYQRICFWAQRSNIMTVFHCMKLSILQKCIDSNLLSIIGLNNSTLSWALRKIEIVQDFLHELQIVPFVCFQIQGETAVDKIRRTGTILLELLHNVDNITIEARGRALFKQLLDILAKLDSKASDELGQRQLWQVPVLRSPR